MNIINVLISCVGSQDRPRYGSMLERYREINVIAESGELYGSNVWVALGRCDVLLINEAVIDQYGFQALRSVISSYPRIKVLLILEKESQYRALTAVSQGIQGVITRASCGGDMLQKAVKALFNGEAWVSRELLPSIYNQLYYIYNKSPRGQGPMTIDGWEKMN